MRHDAGTFTTIPTQLVKDQRVSSDAKMVYLALSGYANEQGYCWPKLETIGAQLGTKKSAVCEHITNLCKYGWVAKERHRQNVYHVRFQPFTPDDPFGFPESPESASSEIPEIPNSGNSELPDSGFSEFPYMNKTQEELDTQVREYLVVDELVEDGTKPNARTRTHTRKSVKVREEPPTLAQWLNSPDMPWELRNRYYANYSLALVDYQVYTNRWRREHSNGREAID